VMPGLSSAARARDGSASCLSVNGWSVSSL
jgi:hypothetical protein